MKAERAISPPVYKPIELRIVLETEDEAAQFYSLFNHSALSSATPALGHRQIKNAIGCIDTAIAFDKLHDSIKACSL